MFFFPAYVAPLEPFIFFLFFLLLNDEWEGRGGYFENICIFIHDLIWIVYFLVWLFFDNIAGHNILECGKKREGDEATRCFAVIFHDYLTNWCKLNLKSILMRKRKKNKNLSSYVGSCFFFFFFVVS